MSGWKALGAVLRCSIGWPSGEYFVDRYGKEAVKHTPPVARWRWTCLGLGTDATRVASYPWTALYWLVSGRTVGGMACMTTPTASARCRAGLWTAGSARFSSEQGRKAVWPPVGCRSGGGLKDYFSVAKRNQNVESVLTVVDGKVVYAAGHFSPLAPIPVLPGVVAGGEGPGRTVPLRRRRLKSAPWCRCTSAAVAVASTAISMILRVSRRFRSLTSRPSGACWAAPALPFDT